MRHSYQQRWLWLFCLFSVGIILVIAFPLTRKSAAQPAWDEKIEMEVIARLNAWRLSEKIPPLKPNGTLRALARGQVEHLLSLTQLPEGEGDAIHRGRKGEQPPERAYAAPYNWPAYGRPDRVAIGENAAVGSVDLALDFWHESEIHRKAALNPAYREVGVGVAPYQNRYLIIVDFGSRPDILPVLIHPKENMLYLTNEKYRWKDGGLWMQDATEIRLFSSKGKPLGATLRWEEKLPVPTGVGGTLYLLYGGGKARTLAAIDIKTDRIILPGYIPDSVNWAEEEDGMTAVASANTPAPAPSATLPSAPPATAAQSGSGQPSTPVSTSKAAEPPGTVAPTAPTEPPLAAENAPNLVLIYDTNSLTVINKSKQPLDLSSLSLVSKSFSIGGPHWRRVVALSLDAFPPNQCLAVYLVGSSPSVPSDCKNVRSSLSFTKGQLFWLQDEFELRKGMKLLGNCAKGPGKCEAFWPQ